MFLGSNILHGIMVQVFSVHQQSVGEFIFSERVCNALITNRDILVDIPFLTLSLQVVASLRSYLQVCHTCHPAALRVTLHYRSRAPDPRTATAVCAAPRCWWWSPPGWCLSWSMASPGRRPVESSPSQVSHQESSRAIITTANDP